MSIHILSWVLRNSPTRLGARLVLIVLADHAAEDGASAYPSVATIAREANLSRRAVQTALRELEAEKHIKPIGESRFGTTEYQILRGRKVCAGEENGTNLEEDSKSASKDAPKPSFEPSFESSDIPPSSPANKYTDEFEEFWAAYPRTNDTKKNAASKYATAVKTTPPAEILQGLRRYVAFLAETQKSGFDRSPMMPSRFLANDFWEAPWTTETTTLTEDPRREEIGKERRKLHPDERRRRKSAGEYPYDKQSAQIMGESKEVEDDTATTAPNSA